MQEKDRVSSVLGTWKKIFLVVAIILSALAMFSLLPISVFALENDTINSSIETDALNNLIVTNTTDLIENNTNLIENNTDLFEFSINNISIKDTLENLTEFIGTIRTIYDKKSVLTPVELNIYPKDINENFTICTTYSNGTSELSCMLDYVDNSLYRVIAIADFNNSLYYQNLTYNVSSGITYSYLISDEVIVNESHQNETIISNESILVNESTLENLDGLNISVENASDVSVSKIDMTITEKDGITTLESFNLTVMFKEAYDGRHIFGNISVKENDTEIYETVEMNIRPLEQPDNLTICHYDVNGTTSFNCTLDDNYVWNSGLYNITTITEHNNKLYRLEKLIYLKIPDFKINLETDLDVNESYSVGDIINVASEFKLGNELLDFINISLEIISPDGLIYTLDGINPTFSFVANVEGKYTVIAIAHVFGIEIQKEIVVIVDDSIPDLVVEEESYLDLIVNMDSSYESEKLMNINVKLYNITEKSTYLGAELLNKSIINNEIEIDVLNSPVLITDPDNVTYEIVMQKLISNITSNEINNLNLNNLEYSTNIEFYPFSEGKYLLDLIVENFHYVTTFNVLNTSNFVEETILLPIIKNSSTIDTLSDDEINVTSQILNITINNVLEENKTSIFDVELGFNESSLTLDNVSNIDELGYLQASKTNDSSIGTDIIALDTLNKTISLNISSAEITLRKYSPVSRIMYCEDWNYDSLSCENWLPTNIKFVENSTHITFNVTHFTAYAGGGTSNSTLEIYDISDTDKNNTLVFINDSFRIYANYSDNLTGTEILNAWCNISISDYDLINLSYSSSEKLYFIDLNISTQNLYEYNISCSESTYDLQEATDNITIYSYANITQLTTEDTTLGYSAELSAKVIDYFNATNIQGYNVTFYSDKEGYIGNSITDNFGMSYINFTPTTLGTYAITANISNSNDTYYFRFNYEEIGTLIVYPSSLKITKRINVTNSGLFNISLVVENTGNNNLNNVSGIDYFSNDFYAENYSIEPSGNFTNINNNGLFVVWNETNINSGNKVYYDYLLIYNGTNNLISPRELYLLGLTHR